MLDRVTSWAHSEPSVRAVAVVGSWARGAAREDSDLDLILLTTDPSRFLDRDDWFDIAGEGALLIRSEDFGAIQERRLRLPSALEVEVGIGTPAWARTSPLDPGTRRVATDGLMILHDPEDLLAKLALATER